MNRFRMPSIALLPIFALAVSAAAPPPAVAQPAVQGAWSDKFDTVNVMVHALSASERKGPVLVTPGGRGRARPNRLHAADLGPCSGDGGRGGLSDRQQAGLQPLLW